MRKKTILFLTPVVIFILAFAFRYSFYYQGSYTGPIVPSSQPDHLEVMSGPLDSSSIPVGTFSSAVLVDDGHGNQFDEEEMTTLYGRITAAGGQVEELKYGDDLREKLRNVDSFIVIANTTSFKPDEILAVKEFVRKGGRLVIVGDPLRLSSVNAINSIAGQFGIIFQDDYVYNLVENDGNYLNVIFNDFIENDITDNLDQIVFQSAHSLRVAEEGVIIMGDENTYSSQREHPGDVIAAALTTDDRVLALPDLTFLTGPFNTVADNDKFIDNIVQFLVSSERSYSLFDFPFFFDQEVDIVYTDSELLDETLEDAIEFRTELLSIGLEAVLSSEVDDDRPLVYLGLFDTLERDVISTLRRDGITFEEDDGAVVAVKLDQVGNLDVEGAVLFHLHQTKEGVYQMFILADIKETLSSAMALLLADELSECLVAPNTAFCEPEVEPTPTPTNTPKPTKTPTPTPEPTSDETPDPNTTPTPTPSE